MMHCYGQFLVFYGLAFQLFSFLCITSQIHFKNLAANAARFLECIWSFWDVMHEMINAKIFLFSYSLKVDDCRITSAGSSWTRSSYIFISRDYESILLCSYCRWSTMMDSWKWRRKLGRNVGKALLNEVHFHSWEDMKISKTAENIFWKVLAGW